MSAADIIAIITAVTALVAAVGGAIANAAKLRAAKVTQDATSVKVDAIHAAVVGPPEPRTP
jgi:hypothetical protein